MDYNTAKGDIIIPEYGRNIQLLIEHGKAIEDKAERQAYIEHIVDLMQQMHPQSRNVDDYVAKLWSHVFRIANYDLDIDPPCEILSREEVYKRPESLPYPDNDVKFRFYGRNVQEMVRKAVAMEDKELQEDYVKVIGAYMKMAYKTWNRDHVSDEMIRKNLMKVSDGKLILEENANIDGLIHPTRQRKKTTSNNSSSSRTTTRTSRTSSTNRSSRSSSSRTNRSSSSSSKRRRK